MNILSIKELKEILDEHDENMLVVISSYELGREYPIIKDDIVVINNPYFGNGLIKNIPKENENVLRIGLI